MSRNVAVCPPDPIRVSTCGATERSERNRASRSMAEIVVTLTPRRSRNLPAKGIARLLANVPIMYAVERRTLEIPRAPMRWSVRTDIPIVCPGMLASTPREPTTRMIHP
jgi:hypothetical protein